MEINVETSYNAHQCTLSCTIYTIFVIIIEHPEYDTMAHEFKLYQPKMTNKILNEKKMKSDEWTKAIRFGKRINVDALREIFSRHFGKISSSLSSTIVWYDRISSEIRRNNNRKIECWSIRCTTFIQGEHKVEVVLKIDGWQCILTSFRSRKVANTLSSWNV